MHLNWWLKNITIRNVKGKGSISKNTFCRNKLLCGCPAWKNVYFKLSVQKMLAGIEKGRKQPDDIHSVCFQAAEWGLFCTRAYITPLILQDNWMFSFRSLRESLVDYCSSGQRHRTTQHRSAEGKAGGTETAVWLQTWLLSATLDHHHPQANWHCYWHLQKEIMPSPCQK